MSNYFLELEKDAQNAGVTLYELCEKADVAASNVPRWKKEETTPNMSTLQKLRDALKKINKRKGNKVVQ